MEWELAVDKLEAGESDFIVPVLVGEYISLADGSKALKKFGAFGGVAGKPWPDEFSTTCKTRTIKQTMQKLFKIQGIHLDPEKVSAASKDIQAALVRTLQTQRVGVLADPSVAAAFGYSALICCCNPDGLLELDAANDEVDELAKLCPNHKVLQNPSVRQFQKEMDRFQPNCLVFIGHGDVPHCEEI
jgi:hypothetical protein